MHYVTYQGIDACDVTILRQPAISPDTSNTAISISDDIVACYWCSSSSSKLYFGQAIQK